MRERERKGISEERNGERWVGGVNVLEKAERRRRTVRLDRASCIIKQRQSMRLVAWRVTLHREERELDAAGRLQHTVPAAAGARLTATEQTVVYNSFYYNAMILFEH